MSRNTPSEFTETHVLGGRTRQWVVRADEHDRREWLKDAPVCPALAQHQIAHAGVASTAAPYRVVRTKQGGAYLLACFGGEGRVLVDGRWQTCRAGMAWLLPPRILNAFQAAPGARWEFCWVRYEQPPEQRPVVSTSSPVLAKFDAEPLRAAILGLWHECRSGAAPAQIHHWVELIQNYVLRFAQPWRGDDRLWKLWEKVAADLTADWTLERLAAEAHLSREHLRRLCRRQLGRSPRHHLTYLRMRRAAELLIATDDKIETIAQNVGYVNPFVFSTTFKKWIGWRPSEHRQKPVAG
ncbi:MAG: AraC family transcriptional regulator [Verrucomicrobia bacterium]|nr:AraC family transcriptional regulator [Verrucomicrobiota bacterium]